MCRTWHQEGCFHPYCCLHWEANTRANDSLKSLRRFHSLSGNVKEQPCSRGRSHAEILPQEQDWAFTLHFSPSKQPLLYSDRSSSPEKPSSAAHRLREAKRCLSKSHRPEALEEQTPSQRSPAEFWKSQPWDSWEAAPQGATVNFSFSWKHQLRGFPVPVCVKSMRDESSFLIISPLTWGWIISSTLKVKGSKSHYTVPQPFRVQEPQAAIIFNLVRPVITSITTSIWLVPWNTMAPFLQISANSQKSKLSEQAFAGLISANLPEVISVIYYQHNPISFYVSLIFCLSLCPQ